MPDQIGRFPTPVQTGRNSTPSHIPRHLFRRPPSPLFRRAIALFLASASEGLSSASKSIFSHLPSSLPPALPPPVCYSAPPPAVSCSVLSFPPPSSISSIASKLAV
ncbi:hypothetical protein PIB30_027138 [Stylosanthes scabra]|uniref:Uncharacterized protein n=1 Tax=Stylosanthes scabra TaxID=79078 RepID=A0ABU6Y9C7_9FABA|nr:hypothetical protein [Stylosanthes scabra]